MNELKIESEAGAGRLRRWSAVLGDEVLHADVGDGAEVDFRLRFTDHLIGRCPAIEQQRDAVQRELMRQAAATPANGQAGKAAAAEPTASRAGPKRPAVIGWRPFPTDALPDPVASYVRESAAAIGCDKSFVALPVLAMLGGAVGNARVIRLKRDWREPAVIWAGIIGESGTTKTPALRAATDPVRRRQSRLFKQHKDAMADHEAKHSEWEQAKKRKGVDPGSEPVAPVCERVMVSECTIEALAARLGDAPRGLLLCRDELSGWIKSFDQYKGAKGGDSAHWLELHQAGTLLVDRKTGDRPVIHVPRAAVSICGGIQPRILAQCLGREHFESGMAARFLLAMPPTKPKRWTDAETPAEVAEAMAAVVDRLYGLAMGEDADGEPTPLEVGLTEAGRQAFIQFVNSHNEAAADLPADERASWSKLEAMAARLALLVHLVRVASGEDGVACDRVGAKSVAAGVRIVEWARREIGRVYAALREGEDGRALRRLVEAVAAAGGSVTLRDWQRRRSLKAAEAQSQLDELVAAGLARWEVTPAGPEGGRPSKRLILVDEDAEPDKTDEEAGVSSGFVSEGGGFVSGAESSFEPAKQRANGHEAGVSSGFVSMSEGQDDDDDWGEV